MMFAGRSLFFPFFLLLGFFPSAAFSQSRIIDSLTNIIRKSADDTNKVNVLLELARVNGEDTSSAKNNINNALALSEKLNYSDGTVKSLITLGNMFVESNQYKRADECLTRAEKKCLEYKAPLFLLLRMKQARGNVLMRTGKYKEAIKIYTRALVEADEIKDNERILNLLTNLTIAYRETEQFELALNYAIKGLKLETSTKDNKVLANFYGGIGGTYSDMAVDDSALKYLNKELKFRILANNQNDLANTLNNLGLVYMYTRQFEKAKVHFDKANKIWEESKNIQGLVRSYLLIATLARELGETGKAISLYEKGLAYSKKAGTPLQTLDYYYYLSRAQYNNRMYKEAFENQLLYSKMHDTVLNTDSRKEMIEMQTKYETDKKEKENALLTSQNKISALEIDRQKNQRNVIIVVFAFIAFAGMILYNRYRLKNKNKILEEINNRNIAVFKAQEEEKSRLSKELHDGVGPLLSLIKLNASAIEANADNKKTIDEIKVLASEGIKEVRNISHALMPSVLEKKGLQSALEEFIETANQANTLKVEFLFSVSSAILPDVQVNIFRIVQEALNNTIKYAGAKNARIQIKEQNGQLDLLISDNGSGFDSEKTGTGNGLNNIYSRVNFLKGTIAVDSRVGNGTVFKIIIPAS
jgi:two-component system, NarL family, sensor kinase